MLPGFPRLPGLPRLPEFLRLRWWRWLRRPLVVVTAVVVVPVAVAGAEALVAASGVEAPVAMAGVAAATASRCSRGSGSGSGCGDGGDVHRSWPPMGSRAALQARHQAARPRPHSPGCTRAGSLTGSNGHGQPGHPRCHSVLRIIFRSWRINHAVMWFFFRNGIILHSSGGPARDQEVAWSRPSAPGATARGRCHSGHDTRPSATQPEQRERDGVERREGGRDCTGWEGLHRVGGTGRGGRDGSGWEGQVGVGGTGRGGRDCTGWEGRVGARGTGLRSGAERAWLGV
jgi:hypothetical protein